MNKYDEMKEFEKALKDYSKYKKEKVNNNNFNLYPDAHCKKCGKNNWMETDEFLTWKCVQCSNIIFYYYGNLKQQIEVIMEARSVRDNEFVHSKDADTIKVKKNEDLKRIKFGRNEQ